MVTANPPSPESGHVPVLPEQVLSVLQPQPGHTMLDCTIGRGGHAALIAPRLAPGGRYIGLDVDPANLDAARQRLVGSSTSAVPVDLIKANFATARAVLDNLGIARVHLLLADLGFASTQMDDPARGFSFQADGPLDMRLDPDLPATAADLVNTLPERELADLIYRFGEERLSRKIARNIVAQRCQTPIYRTKELADVVRRAYGRHGSRHRIDPATRTFMALRIAVNAELEALHQLLDNLPGLLAAGGRAAIISFHSLEDRMVKRAFLAFQQAGLGRRLTRKPLVADEAETARNPRSRSAKLRALEWKPAASPDQGADESDDEDTESVEPFS